MKPNSTTINRTTPQYIDFKASYTPIPDKGLQFIEKDNIHPPMLFKIASADILFAYCCNNIKHNCCMIVLKHNLEFCYITRTTMKLLRKKLLSDMFLQVHCSFIINKLQIFNYDFHNLLFVEKYKIPISHHFEKVVKKLFHY